MYVNYSLYALVHPLDVRGWQQQHCDSVSGPRTTRVWGRDGWLGRVCLTAVNQTKYNRINNIILSVCISICLVASHSKISRDK